MPDGGGLLPDAADILALYRALPIGLIITNTQGVVLDINQYGAELVGCNSIGDSIGKALFSHVVDTEKFNTVIQRLNKTGKAEGNILLHKRDDGREVWVRSDVHSIYTDSGELCGYVCSAQDISRERQYVNLLDLQRELAESLESSADS